MPTACVGNGLQVVGGVLAVGDEVVSQVYADTRVVGTAPPAGPIQLPVIQCGTAVDTTSVLGGIRVIYPVPFLTRVLSLVVTQGDTQAGAAEIVGIDHGDDLLTEFVVRFYDHDGVATSGGLRRCNWIAIGN